MQIWIGALGKISTDAWTEETKTKVSRNVWQNGNCCIPVYLTEEEIEGHYNQFCKQILWKPFHYQLSDYPKGQAYEELAWRQYVAVNRKFANVIVANYRPTDIIWINDYHLMLVPAMVREQLPDATIGFFLHIPFPSSEIFRCLHVRKQILQGMLGADLIGFQTYSFMRHFLMTCTRLLSLESTPKGIQMDNTIVSVGIFPIGINLNALNQKRDQPDVHELIAALSEKYSGKQVLIGRDKNDYVKGVRQKMLAFEQFLNAHPEFHGKVVLIQVALSTTEENENECQVSDVIARINSKYGTIEYSPVVYLHQDISFSHYLALLTIADACLITSLRDGMNLTSHEYVVCQEKKHSPLIISEFAGTYGSFGAALRINPWNTREVADSIYEALTMSEEDKVTRWHELYKYVTTHTAQNYVETFVSEVPKVHEEVQPMEVSHIPLLSMKSVISDYELSSRRIFFLDHDGTLCLTSRSSNGQSVTIESNIGSVALVTALAADPRNLVYIMSGRKRDNLQEFIGIPNVGVSAENGTFLLYANKNKWETLLSDQDLSWRKQVLDIFEFYTDRTPGSYIEQKEVGIVWHYDHADVSFGSWQAGECQNHIQNALGSSFPIHTLVKKKSIEVMLRNVNKGMNIRRILDHHQGRLNRRYSSQSMDLSSNNHCANHQYSSSPRGAPYSVSPGSEHHLNVHTPGGGSRDNFDFILCIGDDRADEYMFEYLQRLDAANNRESLNMTESPFGGDQHLSPMSSPVEKKRASWTPTSKSSNNELDTLRKDSRDPDQVLPTLASTSNTPVPIIKADDIPLATLTISQSEDQSRKQTVPHTASMTEEQTSSDTSGTVTPKKGIPSLNHHHSLPTIGIPFVDSMDDSPHNLRYSVHGTNHHHQHHQHHHRSHHHGHHQHGQHHHHHSNVHQHQHNIRRTIYTVTVGSKSSNAKWYVPGVMEVLELLEVLAVSTGAM
ncbi:hypothetical protein HDV05_004210 [Chytridiales sp. JEL 0842]|nr:hypothetical protein HDV05_004210 [Chytridiales sp. JEL 0842]